ncbi:hypothetical protein [Maribacter sp. 2307UL18-2]|uniref:hypothetical protein n=1 Tax=Maribacter sp. 2307UL18-2 TaxID=3386274 RepID=UPI0039BCFAA6
MSLIDLESLKKERNRLMKKLELVDGLIDEYSNIDPELDFKLYKTFDSKGFGQFALFGNVKDAFPKDKTWLKQIQYILDTHERFLGNTEMAELLLPYYPDKNVDRLKRKVSVVISDAFKNKKVRGLIKLKISSLPQGFVWGYKKWLDSKGDIREKFKPFINIKSPTR